MAGRPLAAAAAVVVVSLSGFRTAAPLARADSTVMAEFVQVVNWVSDTYGTGPIYTSSAPLPNPNTFAMTVGRRIVLNSTYSNDPARFAADIQRNIAIGWIPPGCSPAATVALHEAGHVIDNLRGGVGTQRVAATYRWGGDALRGQISLYSYGEDGLFDADEAVASAFQSVLCNGGTEVEQDMYWMLVQP